MGGFMSCLSDKSGCELIFLASSFALALAQGLSCDDINLLSLFLSSVADNLAILANQCSENEETSESDESDAHNSL